MATISVVPVEPKSRKPTNTLKRDFVDDFREKDTKEIRN